MATKKKTTVKAKAKRATVKKPVKATAVGKTVKTQQSKMVAINKWNIIFAVLFVLQAIVVFIIGKAYTLPVVSQYLAPDSLATQVAGHNVYGSAVRHLFDIDIRYIILAYLLVAALIYILIATVKRANFEAGLQKRVDAFRWLNFGITSAIMLTLIAMLNGVYDSAILLAVIVLIGILHFLGYFGEAKVTEMKSKMQNFVTVCVAGATVWLIVLAYLKGAIFYGNGLNSMVYWIDGVILVITLGLAYVKLQTLRAKGKWADYLFGEQIFMILSFLAVTSLTWLAFAGFLK